MKSRVQSPQGKSSWNCQVHVDLSVGTLSTPAVCAFVPSSLQTSAAKELLPIGHVALRCVLKLTWAGFSSGSGPAWLVSARSGYYLLVFDFAGPGWGLEPEGSHASSPVLPGWPACECMCRLRAVKAQAVCSVSPLVLFHSCPWDFWVRLFLLATLGAPFTAEVPALSGLGFWHPVPCPSAGISLSTL